MAWADGSSFEGIWKNDNRLKGRMLMSNGYIYEGDFKNDQFDSKCAKLYLPQLTIFEGSFENGVANSIGFILLPNGDIYCGQHMMFERQGLGK